MPSRDLEVNIDGDPTGWNKALRSAERESAKFRKEVQKLEGQLKKHQAQMEKSSKSATLMRGEMATLVAAGATVAPAFLAAGAGVVAFAGLAVPSIMKVIQAQQDLAANWDTLSQGQKVSAVATRNLITQYKDLAKSLEPEALQNFNASLGVVSTLMPKLVPLARESSKAFLDFQQKLGAALDSQPVDEFFSFLEKSAGPAIGQVTDASMALVGAAGSLIQAWAPLAQSGLGLVTMLANLVGGLAKVSPELAQLVTLSVALRGPLSGIGGFLENAGKKATAFGEANKGASKATKALNLVTSAGPNLYVAAGVALAFFAVKALTAESNTDKLVATMRQFNGAVGNNVKGYQAMNAALDKQLAPATQRAGQAMKDMTSDLSFTSIEMYKGASAAQALTKEWTDQAKADNVTAVNNIRQGADALAKQYGITAQQAIALADAIGVNLSTGILENGKITATTAGRFQQYMVAVEAARNPTEMISGALKTAANEGLGLKERVDALKTSLDALFTPSINAFNATTQVKAAFEAASAAVKKSNGNLSTATEKSRAARDAFAGFAQKVSDAAEANYAYTNTTKGAEAAEKARRQTVLSNLPALAKLAGGNKDAQNQVARLAANYGISGNQAKDAGVKTQGLIDKINALHSKKVEISAKDRASAVFKAAKAQLDNIRDKHITISASYSLPSGNIKVAGGQQVKNAKGGYIASGPGTTTSDSIPALLSKKEFVVNAKDTARTLPLLKAINAGKYRNGGMVKGYASGGMATSANVPVNEFVSRFIGDPYQTGDHTKAINDRKAAVAQLRAAEKKLADDRKKHKSKKTIKDDEARVAKERLDLAAATNKLHAAETALLKTKMTPAQKLQGGLTLGIKNTQAFIANITKLSDMGFGALAQQLLAEGGPEAEAFAASAVKLPKSSLTKLNNDVTTASKQQTYLDQLPNILKVKDAVKKGAKTVGAIAQATGLTEEEIAAANEQAHLFAKGGIRRPGVATGPMAIFGERGNEAFIPYDRAHRSRAMGLVNQVASDFGMVRRSSGASSMTSAAAAAVQHVTNNHFSIQNGMDPNGVAREIEKVLNRQQRDRGRTSYSFAR